MDGSTGGTAAAGALRGTIAPNLVRLLVRAGVKGGLERSRLARIPGLTVLDENGIRLPTGTAVEVWELIPGRVQDAGEIDQITKLWRPGALGVWDYFFPVADTLDAAFRMAGRHFTALADPADQLCITRREAGLTISYQGPYADHEQYPRIGRFVPHLLLTMASFAAGRRLAPLRVGLPDAGSVTSKRAAELYNTERIDAGVDHPSITFSEADADAPLPRADTALAAILADHARLSAATARPVLGWLDRFHRILDSGLADGPPSLDQVAHRLAMSPRTLQRRLRDEGTSWREELEKLRQRRVERLLRDTELSMDAIAARVGFTDSRSLRRAVHRWYGHGPARVRATGPA